MNQTISALRVEHPSAWTRASLMTDKTWVHRLDEANVKEIQDALRAARATGLTPATLCKDSFPLPRVGTTLARIADELEVGRGIALLRGVPTDFDRASLELLYAGIGAHLGTPVAQSREGELIGSVTDSGKRLGDARGSKTRDPLPFHTDRSDVVGLFCLRTAKSGGESYVISATALHNALLDEAPELCAALYQRFYHRRTDWEAEYSEPTYGLPVFSRTDGHFAVRYLRHFIRTAQDLPETPRLTGAQNAALDRIDALCADPTYFASMPFEVGDIQFLNNFVALHSRAGYEDDPDPEQRRLLLRLWLSVPNSRPLHPDFAALYGNTGAGQLRGGVPVESMAVA